MKNKILKSISLTNIILKKPTQMLSVLSIFILVISPLPSLAEAVSGKNAAQILALNLELNTPVNDAKIEAIESQYAKNNSRELFRLHLNHEKTGSIKLLVSGPRGFLTSNQKKAVVFVTAGFTVGEDSILLLKQDTELIYVGYDYPYEIEQVKKDPSLFLKTLRLVPGQIALALRHLSQQAWVGNIHTIGISLGGLFLPVSQHLAMDLGVIFKSTVLGFTGNDISMVTKLALSNDLNPEAVKLIASVMQNLLTLQDPKIHLPYLLAPTLVLKASQDQLFSNENSQAMFDQISSSKTMITIQGPHIDIDQPEVIAETQKSVAGWLSRYESGRD